MNVDQGTRSHAPRDLGEQIELRRRVVDAMKRHAFDKKVRYCPCERCDRARRALDAWKEGKVIQ